MTGTNHQFRLAARPVGLPRRDDWMYIEEPVRQPRQGEFLAKILYISLDPAMRGWMREGKSYIPPVALGEVMRALALGRVVESQRDSFSAGDYVYGPLGVQEYAVSNGAAISKVDPRIAPLPVFLGTLGMPGMAAFFGLLDVGRPQAGETVVVSGAAGAVGSVVGQIAKIKGCKVVGIAGSKQKCDYVTKTLGFDAAIDYKTENVMRLLPQHCPNGIHVYFDNVGGEILEAVLTHIARGARIVICGAISQYNNPGLIHGPSNYLSLLVNRASMTGMLVSDYANRFAAAGREIVGWMAEGKLKSREQIVEGFENFPEIFLMLFKGENTGKLILKIADP